MNLLNTSCAEIASHVPTKAEEFELFVLRQAVKATKIVNNNAE
jgi:hypothetical protein